MSRPKGSKNKPKENDIKVFQQTVKTVGKLSKKTEEIVFVYYSCYNANKTGYRFIDKEFSNSAEKFIPEIEKMIAEKYSREPVNQVFFVEYEGNIENGVLVGGIVQKVMMLDEDKKPFTPAKFVKHSKKLLEEE
jgi:hypothetical protein